MPVTLKTGSLTITVPSNDPKEIFKSLSFWSSEFPQVCGNPKCKSTEVSPHHRNTKGFDFYSARCSSCGYEAAFGQYREGGGLFLKRDEGWKPPYKHDADSQGTTSYKQKDLEDESDVPF